MRDKDFRFSLVLMEGIIMAFWLLFICVVGIANGPVVLGRSYENMGYLRNGRLETIHTRKRCREEVGCCNKAACWVDGR